MISAGVVVADDLYASCCRSFARGFVIAIRNPKVRANRDSNIHLTNKVVKHGLVVD